MEDISNASVWHKETRKDLTFHALKKDCPLPRMKDDHMDIYMLLYGQLYIYFILLRC